MTGPEHYQAGEQMLISAWKRSASDGETLIQTPERRAELIATAQAHFTAALAAATALVANDDPPPRDADAWYRAAGTHEPVGGAS